jgi:hypothetical protein
VCRVGSPLVNTYKSDDYRAIPSDGLQAPSPIRGRPYLANPGSHALKLPSPTRHASTRLRYTHEMVAYPTVPLASLPIAPRMRHCDPRPVDQAAHGDVDTRKPGLSAHFSVLHRRETVHVQRRILQRPNTCIQAVQGALSFVSSLSLPPITRGSASPLGSPADNGASPGGSNKRELFIF